MEEEVNRMSLWWLCPTDIQPWEELCVIQDTQGESHVHLCAKVTLWRQCRNGRWLTVLSWWLIPCPARCMTPYIYQKHCNNSFTQSNSLHSAVRPSPDSTASYLIHRRRIHLSIPEGHTFSAPSISLIHHILANWNSTILSQIIYQHKHYEPYEIPSDTPNILTFT